MPAVQTPPRPRRRLWIVLVLLALLIVGGAIIYWLAIVQLEAHGWRLVFGQPGAGMDIAGKAPPIAPAADLARDGVRVEVISVAAEGDRFVIMQRVQFKLWFWLTAGARPLETARVGYTLFAADNRVVGTGVVGPQVRIEAGRTVSVEIVDARLGDAARVELHELP